MLDPSTLFIASEVCLFWLLTSSNVAAAAHTKMEALEMQGSMLNKEGRHWTTRWAVLNEGTFVLKQYQQVPDHIMFCCASIEELDGLISTG
eukprot:TRINITY_DN32650_c0_g1_i1.p1 TRINITY_DN32650_c0_g1~~TRINITY_DN32650_c0_g1_i1.p1  ORF type:complete len:107 (-),score=9.75 TRINITY_DN32650_c0_g1_i1:270-542(-)